MATGRTNAAGGGLPASILDKISYTGTMLYSMKWMEGVLYHLLTLESSGNLTVTGAITGDVWMCGAGGNGAIRSTGNAAGGGGGYTNNAFGVAIVSGAVSIGAPSVNVSGSGGSTTYDGRTANGGGGASQATGGIGGSGGGGTSAGTGQGSTTRPFTSADMRPQCGGGGQSRAGTALNGAHGGTDGGNCVADAGTQRYGGDGGLYGGKGGEGVTTLSDCGTSTEGYGGGGGGISTGTISGQLLANPGAVMIRIAA